MLLLNQFLSFLHNHHIFFLLILRFYILNKDII